MLSLTFPKKTVAHRLPASVKFAALALIGTWLFTVHSLAILAVAVFFAAILYLMMGWQFARQGGRMILSLWPFVIIVMGWHLYRGAAGQGAEIVLRLIAAVGLANFVTMTTRLDQMIDLFTWLAKPLRLFGLSPKVFGVAIALVIRFTPTMLTKAEQLAQSWRARSIARPRWNLVVPLLTGALDDADRIADALRARGGLE